VSREELGLPVPAASVPHFATLDRTIETSLELSRTGRTLTPPTQPEVQVFRRWLCEEVLGQAVGAEPRPWTVEGDQADLVWHQELDWDPVEVVGASSPRVAADAANRIVAVNDAALELLGYDDAGQLVGHRLVVLIPERYRQAHVAGFTMYLLTGRRPLLGTEVRVPVVRSGGEELDVWMRVEEEPAGDGSQVFVADLRAV
jgi:PAS domain S-box-containing protein